MNFLQILRRSSRLTLVNAIGVALNFLAGGYVANFIGPEAYGMTSLVLLWVSYSGLVRPGLFEGGQRELIAALGRGDQEAARRYQNTGFSGELLWGLMPTAVLLAAAFLAPDPFRMRAFLLAPLLYLGQACTRMLGGLMLAHQKTGLYTAACVVRALVQPPLLLLLARTSGPIALILAPALVECCVTIFYWRRRQQLGIAWEIHLPTARSLIAVGFPLAVSAIAYWAYRLAGSTCIAAFLPTAALGAYVFASRIVDQITRFFGDFANILMPGLWGKLARVSSPREVSGDLGRVTGWLVMLACFACNLLQATASQAIIQFLPRFESSIKVLELLSFNMVLLALPMTAGLVLDSSTVNKQKLHVSIWIAGAAINYSANYFCLRSGYPLVSIAWNDLWVQVVVAALIFAAVHKHLFEDALTAWRFHAPPALMAGSCWLVYWALQQGPFRAASPGPATLGVFFLRITLVVGIWLAEWYCLRAAYRRSISVAPERQ